MREIKNMKPFNLENFDILFAECMKEVSKLTYYSTHDTNDILWTKSDLPSTWYNCICNLSNDNSNRESLFELIQKYIDTQTQFYLYNGIYKPGKDSIETILSSGAHPIGFMDGMAFDLNQKIPTFSSSQEIKIYPVISESDFNVFSQTQREANEVSHLTSEHYFKNFSALKDSSIKLFLAYFNDQPAGCSLIYFGANKLALNNWDWVKPEFKQRGINSTMVIERLRIAKSLGFEFVAAQCIDTSTRLYANIGFKKLCEFDIYERYQY